MAEVQNTERFDYVNEIQGIADYVRDVTKWSEYNKIILPFSFYVENRGYGDYSIIEKYYDD